jgi:hypothetical protein
MQYHHREIPAVVCLPFPALAIDAHFMQVRYPELPSAISARILESAHH